MMVTMHGRCTATLAPVVAAAVAVSSSLAFADNPVPEVTAIAPGLEALYRDLHSHPELAFHEQRTAGVLEKRLRALGFSVTTNVGGTGVVGVLRNGLGPVVMLRTELDALPIEEKTGLSFASHEHVTDAQGTTVPVAHACGHDLHMAAWTGTGTVMAAHRDRWRGTLVLLAQPAEEPTQGARAMIDDGLFTRFPRPDFAIGMHDESSLPAGQIGFHAGPFRASRDSIEVVLHGRGGHAAKPQMAVDPIVMAARVILGLQTVVSRENDPLVPAVVTVTDIHAGTPASVIPEEVRMHLTVRTFDANARARILASIRRQIDAEAVAADAPMPPEVTVTPDVDAVVNDPQLTERLVVALRRSLGPESVREMPQKMTSEDFALYGRSGIPAVLLHIGAVDPAVLANGGHPPDLHSPLWAPMLEPTLQAMVAAEVVILRELMPAPDAGQ